MLSIRIGPPAYGYGFACALLIATLVAMRMLDAKFSSLEYETYMLQ